MIAFVLQSRALFSLQVTSGHGAATFKAERCLSLCRLCNRVNPSLGMQLCGSRQELKAPVYALVECAEEEDWWHLWADYSL